MPVRACDSMRYVCTIRHNKQVGKARVCVSDECWLDVCDNRIQWKWQRNFQVHEIATQFIVVVIIIIIIVASVVGVLQ
jgi:hypothetical protein